MNLETLKEQLPDYAKDIKLNLSSVLTEAGSPGLTPQVIIASALASAYVTKNNTLIAALTAEAQSQQLAEEEIRAAKAAATIMAMNNIYYRSLHLVTDEEYSKMPARLRMNIINNSGVAKINFEAYALAVSVMNGCGLCIDAHAKNLLEHGLNKEAVQSLFRIAAVVNAAAQALAIEA